MKLGIALSGGGIKGAAHIGVLKALEEENIKIDYISGSSSGSIIATLYAVGYNIDELLDIFKMCSKHLGYFSIDNIVKLVANLFFKRTISISGLNNGRKVEKIIKKLCKAKGINLISDIKMPIVIPAVSLNDGKVYIFTNKNNYIRSYNDTYLYKSDVEIEKCVRASSSFPGVFEPVSLDGDLLIDGGIRENTPWRELKKLGATFTISVVFETEKEKKKNNNFIDILEKSLSIMMHELESYELTNAQFVLKIPTPKTQLLETEKIDELYNIGYQKAKQAINNIKEILKKQAL